MSIAYYRGRLTCKQINSCKKGLCAKAFLFMLMIYTVTSDVAGQLDILTDG